MPHGGATTRVSVCLYLDQLALIAAAQQHYRPYILPMSVILRLAITIGLQTLADNPQLLKTTDELADDVE